MTYAEAAEKLGRKKKQLEQQLQDPDPIQQQSVMRMLQSIERKLGMLKQVQEASKAPAMPAGMPPGMGAPAMGGMQGMQGMPGMEMMRKGGFTKPKYQNGVNLTEPPWMKSGLSPAQEAALGLPSMHNQFFQDYANSMRPPAGASQMGAPGIPTMESQQGYFDPNNIVTQPPQWSNNAAYAAQAAQGTSAVQSAPPSGPSTGGGRSRFVHGYDQKDLAPYTAQIGQALGKPNWNPANAADMAAWQDYLAKNRMYAGKSDSAYGKGTHAGTSEWFRRQDAVGFGSAHTDGTGVQAPGATGTLSLPNYQSPWSPGGGADGYNPQPSGKTDGPVNIDFGETTPPKDKIGASDILSHVTQYGLPFIDDIVNAGLIRKIPDPAKPIYAQPPVIDTNANIQDRLRASSQGARAAEDAASYSNLPAGLRHSMRGSTEAKRMGETGQAYAYRDNLQNQLKAAQAEMAQKTNMFNTYQGNKYQDDLYNTRMRRNITGPSELWAKGIGEDSMNIARTQAEKERDLEAIRIIMGADSTGATVYQLPWMKDYLDNRPKKITRMGGPTPRNSRPLKRRFRHGY